MAANIKDGAIVRLKDGKFRGVLELDQNTRVATVSDFNGSEYQQWRVSKDSRGRWRFQNVATGLYLGKSAGKSAEGRVVGTSFAFSWELKPGKTDKTFRLWVPYTNRVLDAHYEGQLPEVPVNFRRSCSEDCQQWSADQDSGPAPPCEAGKVYKIVNVKTGSVAHLQDGKVDGYRYNQGPNQVWEAIPYSEPGQAYLWHFKNVSNGLYLGIANQESKHEVRVIGTTDPFVWNLVPFGFAGEYHLNVPFTTTYMDLCGVKADPGTVIHIDPSRRPGNSWRFEREQ